MSARTVSMRALRRQHRRDSWRPASIIERDGVVVGIVPGAHRVSFRAWLRARPRDIRLVGKALRIANAVQA